MSGCCKPEWVKVKSINSLQCGQTSSVVHKLGLYTVCEEAACPNIGECWRKKHAAFMIMGDSCTRNCLFCNVKRSHTPPPLDENEPKRVAEAVCELRLKHVVITSVTRDDLKDGGAAHFAKTITEIKKASPSTTIEALTPDFIGKADSFKVIVDAGPDVFNHNIETVPRLYPVVRPQGRYFAALKLLASVGDYSSQVFTKSGIMVGLGETNAELFQVMDDLRYAGVSFLTIGQYLRPSLKNSAVDRFVTPEEFKEYEKAAYKKGFLMVASSALTRSSYNAGADFVRLRLVAEADCKNTTKIRTVTNS
ncbi:MAG: lipoyl synthase [Holosporales bacterium]|jgi:lipoic acid synthetase|nr:lipoyl synthase [Holosporales bacterium]